ncbi:MULTISPECIES: toxic anion resistance protein [Actinoplanes]|uniref:Toxic anion resistance protein n=2 Tax=Actinoplanes TaxID=1865 RepID=A0A101JKQ1_9ACTN|nr:MULTISPECIES: toxic anion resistance protein [Actinoplanes]KUL28532.1 toxic anion resistance protein [Actinoplanes awajinensis subsp. mycoplanecinus]GIE71466.1 protein involved in tellurite resistance [Actinoplanes palleronii]
MSSLDLGPSPAPLVLAPPAAVVEVTPEQAVGAVVVPQAKQTELQQRATAFADELAALDPRSPEFTQKVGSITSMGQQDMQAAASSANRMLERPAAAIGKGGGDAQTRVAKTLADLRITVTDLDPKRADLTGIKKALKWLPGGDKIDRYFNNYRSAQSHLDAIIRALASGQDELRKDNAAIETEKANLWASMGRISEYNELAAALDEAIAQKVAALEVAGRTEDASALTSDALFAIRQRRQDLMTQMAVSVQGYMALDLIRKNNLELIRGVDRSQTTTVAALRIAVIVSQALSRQKLVLDQINALNTVTSNLIEATSQQLRTQGAEINQQAASATVDVEKLQAAFDNVFATMDAIDTFRAQAADSMVQTIQALEGQVQRAQPYLERVRRHELGS